MKLFRFFGRRKKVKAMAAEAVAATAAGTTSMTTFRPGESAIARGECIVASKYKLQRKIGAGSFGDIYLAVVVGTDEQVAVKLESSKVTY